MRSFFARGRAIAPLALFGIPLLGSTASCLADSKPSKMPHVAAALHSAQSICLLEEDDNVLHDQKPSQGFLSLYRDIAALNRFEFMATARGCDVVLAYRASSGPANADLIDVINPKAYSLLGTIKASSGILPTNKNAIKISKKLTQQIAAMSGPPKSPSVPAAPAPPESARIPFTPSEAAERLRMASTVFVDDEGVIKGFQKGFDIPWVPKELSQTFLRFLGNSRAPLRQVDSPQDADVILKISGYIDQETTVTATHVHRADETSTTEIPTLYVLFVDPMTLMPLCQTDTTRLPSRGHGQSFDTHTLILRELAGDFVSKCLYLQR
ncbi:MAG: hypothetical protein PW792_09405 [Acidobacteriaceae bacterium]|nr:hypothetical protein [Acidobacteriaceae bacterium]